MASPCLCVCRPCFVSASGLSAPFAGRSSVAESAEQFRKRVVELKPRAEARYGERVDCRWPAREPRWPTGCRALTIQIFSGSATDRGPTDRRRAHRRRRSVQLRAYVADATRTLRFTYSGTPVMLPIGEPREPADLGRLHDPRHPSTAHERSKRSLLRKAARPSGAAGRQAHRTTGCALRSLANLPNDAHPSERRRGRSAITSGEPAACCGYRFRARLPAESGLRVPDRIHQERSG